METVFDKAYKSLNADQKQAVDTIDGPVMVIAGPGTGKTQVLAARIAKILLTTDTNPYSVLALTFTESAAKNMRERLVSLIGKTAYYVQIHTFHSFCTDVINSHPDYFPIDRDSQPISDLEKYDLMQNLIQRLPLEVLKPMNSPYFYLRDLLKDISDLKREGVDPDTFAKIVEAEQTLFDQEKAELKKGELTKREKNLAKAHELLTVYREYQAGLRETLRFDYDDMISFVVQAFSTQEELLLEYQEKLLYFLVDEYQDTNSAQNQVVDLLASFWGDEANVFVVGDPNQAIYRFQGASLENVINFTQRYSLAKVITLKTGYRSPQKIYNTAADLIKENTSAGELAESAGKPLKSVKGPGADLLLFAAPSQTLENVYLACKIKTLIEQSVAPEDIAILYRNNADALEITETLDKWNIRYEVDGGNNVLDAEHISQLLSLFKVIDSIRLAQEDGLLYEVMQYDWLKLDLSLIMKAARAASKAKLSVFELIRNGYETFIEHHTTGEVTALDFAALTNFVDKLTEWAARDAQLTFTAWFELVINDSGFLPWVMEQPNKIELLNAVNSLFRQVKSLVLAKRDFQLHDFLTNIETLQEHHLGITIEDLNVKENAVHLSTVHKAKGQEWRYVFIARTIDGKWGNGRPHDMIPLPAGILKHQITEVKDRNEDDRRLFYVALTRAKDQVLISYPETMITDNRSKSTMGSLFLEEIKDHLVADDSPEAKDVINKADEHLAQLLVPETNTHGVSERDFLANIVKDFKLSVTSLNTYLHQPQLFIPNCLLKVPSAKTPALSFGTAIHASLEYWFKHWQLNSEKASLESLLTSFESSLTKEPLTSDEYKIRLRYGQEVLGNYYEKLVLIEKPPVFVERFFGFGFSQTVLDDISLTGRIDRVDWVDQSLKTVCVIDYKTGKPRTLGEIEGKTQSAELSEREQSLPESIRGGYKRQLLFYKLLTELDRSFLPTVTEAQFVFVEPDKQSGNLITRRVGLPDAEVEQLKDLIREVMGEIRTLKFLG